MTKVSIADFEPQIINPVSPNTVLRKLTESLNYPRLSPLYNATFLSM